MTSGSIFPQRLTKIDKLTRPDHSYLDADDECLFLGEYTARKGYAYSVTNKLILNFKKAVDRRGLPEWQYKESAIKDAAAAFRAAIPLAWLSGTTLVPIPPSKAKTDPLYDDRMLRMVDAIMPNARLDIRDMIIQVNNLQAAHGTENRLTPQDLRAAYQIDGALVRPTPDRVALVDDVLTTGAHFKAGQALLQRAFPETPIIGLFIARRVPEAVDLEDFF